jgi:hypothetical protein
VAQPVATVAEIPAPIPVKDVEPVAAPIASAVVPTTQAPVIDSSPKVEIEIKVCFLFLINWFHIHE